MTGHRSALVRAAGRRRRPHRSSVRSVARGSGMGRRPNGTAGPRQIMRTSGIDSARCIPVTESREAGQPRNRSAGTPTYRMCYAHVARWNHRRRQEPGAVIETWCRTERPVSDSRCVVLAGLAPLVARQILFGVFNRSRRGSHTRLEALQRVVDFLRHFEPTYGDVSVCSRPRHIWCQPPVKDPVECQAMDLKVTGTHV